MVKTNLPLDADRLWSDVMALAEMTDPARPYTRRSFTALFLEGRAWLAQRFAEADLIFLDGPKDGYFEARFLANLLSMKLQPHALLVLDDIRLWNMLRIWRDLPPPKLDMTSFGHWSGTGFVEIP